MTNILFKDSSFSWWFSLCSQKECYGSYS